MFDNKKYGEDERLLEAVLTDYPRNDDINIVAPKVALIELTNSTQISKSRNKITLFDIASIICNIKDFDERVKNGDPLEIYYDLQKESTGPRVVEIMGSFARTTNADPTGDKDANKICSQRL